MRASLLAIVLLGALVSACEQNGPLMSPGQDCQQSGCHAADRGERSFTVSGTVFPDPGSVASAGIEAVSILIVDADDNAITIESNEAGNFYTDEELRFPVFVAVQRDGVTRHMEPSTSNGGCNSCHTVPSTGSAGGRIYVGPTPAPAP